MNNAICGYAPQWLIDGFSRQGINLISIGTATALSKPISHHIDMMLFKFPDGTVFCAPETKPLIEKYFNPKKLITTEKHLHPGYPDEALLNVSLFGNKLICNTSTAAKEILNYAKEHGYEIIHVNQGYTNCSICNIGDEAIITDDDLIFNSFVERIPALKFQKGLVSLPGYEYGFIGGATAFYDDTIYFFGSLNSSGIFKEYESFFNSINYKVCELSNENALTDIGGIVFLDE